MPDLSYIPYMYLEKSGRIVQFWKKEKIFLQWPIDEDYIFLFLMNAGLFLAILSHKHTSTHTRTHTNTLSHSLSFIHTHTHTHTLMIHTCMYSCKHSTYTNIRVHAVAHTVMCINTQFNLYDCFQTGDSKVTIINNISCTVCYVWRVCMCVCTSVCVVWCISHSYIHTILQWELLNIWSIVDMMLIRSFWKKP